MAGTFHDHDRDLVVHAAPSAQPYLPGTLPHPSFYRSSPASPPHTASGWPVGRALYDELNMPRSAPATSSGPRPPPPPPQGRLYDFSIPPVLAPIRQPRVRHPTSSSDWSTSDRRRPTSSTTSVEPSPKIPPTSLGQRHEENAPAVHQQLQCLQTPQHTSQTGSDGGEPRSKRARLSHEAGAPSSLSLLLSEDSKSVDVAEQPFFF